MVHLNFVTVLLKGFRTLENNSPTPMPISEDDSQDEKQEVLHHDEQKLIEEETGDDVSFLIHVFYSK